MPYERLPSSDKTLFANCMFSLKLKKTSHTVLYAHLVIYAFGILDMLRKNILPNKHIEFESLWI